jgi:hypothetical protein
MQATRLPLQEETKAAKAFPQSDQIGLYLCYLRLLSLPAVVGESLRSYLLLVLWEILDILNRGIIKTGVSARARSRYIHIA